LKEQIQEKLNHAKQLHQDRKIAFLQLITSVKTQGELFYLHKGISTSNYKIKYEEQVHADLAEHTADNFLLIFEIFAD